MYVCGCGCGRPKWVLIQAKDETGTSREKRCNGWPDLGRFILGKGVAGRGGEGRVLPFRSYTVCRV